MQTTTDRETLDRIVSAAEHAVRQDVAAGFVKGGVAAYEAATAELRVIAEGEGVALGGLRLRSLAQTVAAAATRR